MGRKRWIAGLLCMLFLLAGCSGGEGEIDTANAVRTGVLTDVFKGEALTLPEKHTIHDKSDIYWEDGCVQLLTQESKDDGIRYWLYECREDGSDPRQTEILYEKDRYITDGIFTKEGLLWLGNAYDRETGEENYSIHLWADGEDRTLFTHVNDLFSDKSAFPREMLLDAEGYYYFYSDRGVLVMSPDGTAVLEHDAGSFVEGLYRDPAGDIWFSVQTNEGKALQRIDRKAGGVGEILATPDGSSPISYHMGEGYDFYYSKNDCLYGCNRDTAAGEPVLNWHSSDINAEAVSRLQIYSPDRAAVQFRERTAGRSATVTVLLQRVPDRELSSSDVVEIAYVTADEDLADCIIRFNRAHDDIRVVQLDYSVYNTRENPKGGSIRLMNDLLGGLIAPDIVCDHTGRQGNLIDVLVEKRLFTDLYACMGEEGRVSRDNLSGCIRNTFTVDGALSAICRIVTVDTLLTTPSFAGEETSWTLDELLDKAASLPAGEFLMERLTRENAVKKLLGTNGFGPFIDLEKGTCDFSGPTFARLLDWVAALPDKQTGGYSGSGDSRYEPWQTGIVKLYSQNYYAPDRIPQDFVLFNTADIVRIGYPVAEKGESGSVVNGVAYVIPTVSRNPEAAWTFLETAVCADPAEMSRFQWWGLPVWKSDYDALAEEYRGRHRFYDYNGNYQSCTDENGVCQVDENSRLNGEPGMHMVFDESLFDDFVAWLDTVGTPVEEKIPPELTSIISEELSAYVGGARGAAETAQIIQSRVSIWLAEHS